MHKHFLSIGQPKLLSVMLFIFGFLAVQRFTTSPINTFICVLPLGLFVMQMLRGYRGAALTYLVLALFLSTHYGGGVYTETVTPLRYIIYLSAIGMLFYLSIWRVNRKKLLLAAFLGCGVAFGSIANAIGSTPLDLITLQRDLLVLLILFVFLTDSISAKLDLHLLFISSLGYLAGEILNILLFYEDFSAYLSFDSLKAFVVFPLIYTLLTRKNLVIQVLIAFATLYIIFLYGTRMLTITFFLFFGAGLIIYLIRIGFGRILLGFLIVLIVTANINLNELISDTDFIKFKAIAFLVQIQENIGVIGISGTLYLLDSVRFAEHELFFDRPILELIFGSGIGSGIYDAKGVLSFVTTYQSAFSFKEIESSTFYNLHDFWIDFGLRFGLLPLAYLIYQIVLREMLQKNIWYGVLFGILILNTTFATSGVLLSALLIRFLPINLEK